jgi:hypothetical protein
VGSLVNGVEIIGHKEGMYFFWNILFNL